MGNLTQTERSRSFGALHQSESQGTYLQELENERIRRALKEHKEYGKSTSKNTISASMNTR
jgi:hypothetical protein